MRLAANFYGTRFLLCLILMLVASFCCAVEPTTMLGEIERLQQLGERDHDQAILQLEKALANLPASATRADQRELLMTLILVDINSGRPDKATVLIDQLEQQGKVDNDAICQAMAYNYRAKILQDDGKLVESLEVIGKAFSISAESDNPLLQIQVENTAGELYSVIGNFKAALQHQQIALRAFDAIKTSSWETELLRARTLNIVGFLYLSIKDQHTGLDYLTKAADVAEPLDVPRLMANIVNNRGYAYADLKQWKLATAEYNHALRIARNSGNANAEATSDINLADVALNQLDYPGCIRFAQQAITIARKINKSDTAAIALGNLGLCHIYSGKLRQGEDEAQQSIDFARKSNALPTMESTLDDLSTAYAKVGLYREAWNALQEKAAISVQLVQAEREHAVIEMRYQYNLSERQREQEEREYKTFMQRIENEKSDLHRVIVALLVVVVLFVFAVFWQLLHRAGLRKYNQQNSLRQLQYLQSRDPLTGALNRSAFQGVIEQLAEVKEPGHLDVLIMLEIDQFNHLVQKSGHAAGEEILVETAKGLLEILRDKDRIIRWSREQFLIYLHGVMPEQAHQLVERALQASDGRHFSDNQTQTTRSAGYILLPLPGTSPIVCEQALALIGEALILAQSRGGNQAVGIVDFDSSAENLDSLLQSGAQTVLQSQAITLHYVRAL